MIHFSAKALTSTSIEVFVSFDPGDVLPTLVRVNEFDANGNLLHTTGDASPLGFTGLFTNLQPNTTFFYQVCTGEAETGTADGCGPFNEFSAKTLPAQSPPPIVVPSITITGAQAFPALLVKQSNGKYIAQDNSIKLAWQSSVEIFSNISWKVTAGDEGGGVNVGGTQTPVLSGSLTVAPVTKIIGLLCEVQISGLPVGASDPASQSIFSPQFSLHDPANTHSFRVFLSQGGIDPSKGIRGLLRSLPSSFRDMMQI
jgi:hypothetical protein